MCRNSVSNWTPVPSIASQMDLGFFERERQRERERERERERKTNFVGWRMMTFHAGSKSFREPFFSEDDKRSLILYMHIIRSVRPLSSIDPLRKHLLNITHTHTARIDLHWHSKIRDRVTFFGVSSFSYLFFFHLFKRHLGRPCIFNKRTTFLSLNVLGTRFYVIWSRFHLREDVFRLNKL